MHTDNILCGVSTLRIFRRVRSGSVSVKTEMIARLQRSFEDFVHEKEGVEFWYGRDLKNLLGYAEWRNFGQVIGSS